MVEWAELLDDPREIMQLYGNEPPVLRGVDLHEIRVGEDGAKLILRLNLPFPKEPPSKWEGQGLNVVQVELALSSLASVSIRGFATRPVVDVSIKRENDKIAIEINEESIVVSARGCHVAVSSISSYIDTQIA